MTSLLRPVYFWINLIAWFLKISNYIDSEEVSKIPASKDFIDIYLEKMEMTKDENSSFYGSQVRQITEHAA
jgi:hypothetical protein